MLLLNINVFFFLRIKTFQSGFGTLFERDFSFRRFWHRSLLLNAISQTVFLTFLFRTQVTKIDFETSGRQSGCSRQLELKIRFQDRTFGVRQFSGEN